MMTGSVIWVRDGKVKRMRLIDADKTVEDLKKNCIDCNSYGGIRCRSCWVDDARLVLEDALTIDAVPVVRCIACRYFKRKVDRVGFCVCGEVTGGRPMMRVGEDFCSYGERMDGDADE